MFASFIEVYTDGRNFVEILLGEILYEHHRVIVLNLCVLKQINPACTLISCFLKMCLHQSHSDGLFPSGFLTQILCAFITCVLHAPTILSLLILSP